MHIALVICGFLLCIHIFLLFMHLFYFLSVTFTIPQCVVARPHCYFFFFCSQQFIQSKKDRSFRTRLLFLLLAQIPFCYLFFHLDRLLCDVLYTFLSDRLIRCLLLSLKQPEEIPHTRSCEENLPAKCHREILRPLLQPQRDDLFPRIHEQHGCNKAHGRAHQADNHG